MCVCINYGSVEPILLLLTHFLAAMRNRARRLLHLQHLSSSLLNDIVANAAAIVVHGVLIRRRRNRRRRSQGFPDVPRRIIWMHQRRTVHNIYNELGAIYFRRAYRMSYKTFRDLALLLGPGIILASGKKQDSKNNLPNGPILPEVRLACALRWFAGGSVYDIMTTYGISHTDALNSCWYIVDAVNSDVRRLPPSFNR